MCDEEGRLCLQFFLFIWNGICYFLVIFQIEYRILELEGILEFFQFKFMIFLVWEFERGKVFGLNRYRRLWQGAFGVLGGLDRRLGDEVFMVYGLVGFWEWILLGFNFGDFRGVVIWGVG